jgi:membrane protease YdiL (CAAX protease family)
MGHIFINSRESRLRAGWRIFLFLLLFLGFSTLIFVIKPLLGDITKREFLENYSVLIVLVLASGASLAVPIARKLFDKKTFVSLGLKWNKKALYDLLFGFFLSGFMAGLIFLALSLFGFISFEGFNEFQSYKPEAGAFDFVQFMGILSLASIAILLVEHIFVGYWEELVFRGYLFQNMMDGMGNKIAIVISCLIYGLIHAMNPNAGLLSSLIIVLFGFMRIYGYLLTNMLWLSMGMHMGWNFFQGPVFGFHASGHEMVTVVKQADLGPAWLSGGDFGPEGSLLIIPVVFLALWIMRLYSRRQE